jgi:hypothetical protein
MVIPLERQLTLNSSLSSDSSGISSEVLEYVRSLPLGSHAIFCYDTQHEAVQAFNSYLQGGLERDEAVHLISPSHDVYAKFLRTTGVDVESLEKDKRLRCLLMSDCCVDKGRLSSAKAHLSATKLIEQDCEVGFKGTRIITPNSEQYYLRYGSPSDLLQYEQELGQTYNLPLSGFCTYNARRLADLGLHDLLLNLFPPHGQIIGKALACARD